MLSLGVESVYGVQEGEVRMRDGHDIALAADKTALSFDDLQRPISVEGVRLGDFAVFAAGMSEDGIGPVTPYMVTERRNARGLLVPWHLMESDMASYATAQLAKIFQSANPFDLVEFQIAQLTLYLNDRFPPHR